MTNYRPTSLLTVFFKVLKEAMYIRLSQNLHTNNILITEQYAFKKRVSTEDDAFRLTVCVLKSVNQKCMWEEFSVIWPRLLIVLIMKCC
jgi:hypothetical protein